MLAGFVIKVSVNAAPAILEVDTEYDAIYLFNVVNVMLSAPINQ